jgi:hypothetical protein
VRPPPAPSNVSGRVVSSDRETIDIVRLTKIDGVPYVQEEPGPYRLDFYYRCLPKQGFGSLREGLDNGIIKPHSPEVRQIT